MEITLTAAIGDSKTYVYRCDDLDEDGTKLHPECGDGWHIIDEHALRAMDEANDPEWYFVTSHIPEFTAMWELVDETEIERKHPQ